IGQHRGSRSRGLRLRARYQRREGHQSADHLRRHHILLHQPAAAAEQRQLHSRTEPFLPDAAGVPQSDRSQPDRRRPAALASSRLCRCGSRQAGAVRDWRRQRQEFGDRGESRQHPDPCQAPALVLVHGEPRPLVRVRRTHAARTGRVSFAGMPSLLDYRARASLHLARLVWRVALAIAGLCLAIAFGFTLYAVGALPPLNPWHRELLGSEFSALRHAALDFDGYLQLEERLFAELRAKAASWPRDEAFVQSRFNADGMPQRLAARAPPHPSFPLGPPAERGATPLDPR